MQRAPLESAMQKVIDRVMKTCGMMKPLSEKDGTRGIAGFSVKAAWHGQPRGNRGRAELSEKPQDVRAPWKSFTSSEQ